MLPINRGYLYAKPIKVALCNPEKYVLNPYIIKDLGGFLSIKELICS